MLDILINYFIVNLTNFLTIIFKGQNSLLHLFLMDLVDLFICGMSNFCGSGWKAPPSSLLLTKKRKKRIKHHLYISPSTHSLPQSGPKVLNSIHWKSMGNEFIEHYVLKRRTQNVQKLRTSSSYGSRELIVLYLWSCVCLVKEKNCIN